MLKGYILPGLLIAALALPAAVIADDVRVREDHPDRHTVVRGDTLWDISAKFLQDPWLWPEIWEINPEIENPHLIYPGDVIYLSYVEGRPVLKVERSAPARDDGTVILSPFPRASLLDHAIPTIPYDAVRQFLDHPTVMTPDEIEQAGYITASDEGRLISGTAHKVYVRGIPNTYSEFDVIRPGTPYYRDPTKWWKREKDVLGYEALKIGTARVEAFGDPSTLRIKHSTKEVLVGDRVVPSRKQEISQDFKPKAPDQQVEGHIISVPAGITRVSQFQIAVVDLGFEHGLKVGNILSVFQGGERIRDPVEGGKIRLPDERAGTLMVVRALEKFSYALVMEASRDIRLYDMVRNP